MAQALGPHGIYVTTVAPGFVETEMAAPLLDSAAGDAIRAQSPLNRAATPQEIARVVVFLATPGTEYMTATIVDVNGASTCEHDPPEPDHLCPAGAAIQKQHDRRGVAHP
jgi:3-oxoacyl-[acyl-carrier protein] reductase